MTTFRTPPRGRMALWLLALTALPTFAQSLPYPLLSTDPGKPIEIIADHTWRRQRIQAMSLQRAIVADIPSVEDKGPITMVVDYTGFVPDSDEPGEELIDTSLECPFAPAGKECAYPITSGQVMFRTQMMATAEGAREGNRVLLADGREFVRFSPPVGANAVFSVMLRPETVKNLRMEAIRVRLFYGAHDTTPIGGQPSRKRIVFWIAAAVTVMLALALWKLRR